MLFAFSPCHQFDLEFFVARRTPGDFFNKIAVGYSSCRCTTIAHGLPINAQIEPTNRCNLKCVMCPRTYEPPPKSWLHDMSLDEFRRVLDEIPTLKSIQLSGYGEPFVHPQLPDLIAEGKRRGIRMVTNSNATLFTPDRRAAILESRLDVLKLSVDSPDPMTYEEIRRGNLHQVRDGIAALTRERDAARQDVPDIRMNVVLFGKNLHQLADFFDFADDVGVRVVAFKLLNTFESGSSVGNYAASYKLPEGLYEEALQRAERFKITTNLPQLRDVFEGRMSPEEYKKLTVKVPCYVLWQECFVSCKGEVRPCCEFYGDDASLGNVFQEDFRSIWNGERYKAYRRVAAAAKPVAPVCKMCNRFYTNVEMHERLMNFKRKLGPFKILLRNPSLEE